MKNTTTTKTIAALATGLLLAAALLVAFQGYLWVSFLIELLDDSLATAAVSPLILSKLKAMSGETFDWGPDVEIDEVFDVEDASERHLLNEMIGQKLIWSEEGRVGFDGDKPVKILLDEWPEFREELRIENAIEAHKEAERAEAEYAWERYNEG